jgi:hypothetical protein
LVHFEGTTSLITLLLPCPLQLSSFSTFGNVPNALVGILQIVLNIFNSIIIIYYLSCQISSILKHNLFNCGHLFLKMIMSMAVNIFKLLLQLKYEVQFFQY